MAYLYATKLVVLEPQGNRLYTLLSNRIPIFVTTITLGMKLILENVDDKHLKLLSELSRTLGFKLTKKAEEYDKPYPADFCETMDRGIQSIKEGRGVKIPLDNLWK